MTLDRVVRADAVRNREKILVTAREQIAAHGPEVGMVEIANAAGVAVGTLYRHFPTKTDLVKAILTERIEELVTAIETCVARVQTRQTQAADEVLQFMGRMLEMASADHSLKTAALALHSDALRCEMTRSPLATRAIRALEQLVDLGRQAGDLRPDLNGRDIVLLASTGPFDFPPRARERWLELIRPGLLPQSGRVQN